METLQVVTAEYATNHHLGFSGVLETSDSVVDEENFGTKAERSSTVDKEKSSIQDAFQLYVKDVKRAELLDRKQESALAKRIESNRQKIEGILFGSKLVFDEIQNLAYRLENREITIRHITVVNDDDEFEMDEQSRVVALVQQLRLVSDDFISRQMIKISGQATKLNRLEKEEIDKLSKRIHPQIQLISFNQSQIEKFTELLVQQAQEIECASEQIAELEQSQKVDTKKASQVAARLAGSKKSWRCLKRG